MFLFWVGFFFQSVNFPSSSSYLSFASSSCAVGGVTVVVSHLFPCLSCSTASNASMKKRPVTQIADLFVIGGIGGFKKCFSKFWLTVVASEFDIKYLYIYEIYVYGLFSIHKCLNSVLSESSTCTSYVKTCHTHFTINWLK